MTTWVLLAGLPATGKSTLARELAALLQAAVLDKDGVRAALFPGKLTDYSSGQDDLCMQAILNAASYITQFRQAQYIFFDGRTFSRRAHIEAVLRAAEAAGAAWRILHLTCSDEMAEARLNTADPGHPANNRNLELYRRIQAAFEPIPYPKLDLDSTHGIEPLLTLALDYLRTSP